MADPWAQFADAPSDPWAQFSDAPGPAQGPAAPAHPSGIGANIKAGAVEGLTGTVGSVVDALNPVNVLRAQGHELSNIWNDATHLFTPMTRAQVEQKFKEDQAFYDSLNPTPHKLNQAVKAVAGYNPEDTTATTFPERLARGVSAGVTGGLIFPAAEGEGFVSGLARNAAVGAGAGAGSTTAAEVAPDDWKQAAGLLGGVVGGGAVGAAEAGVNAARATGGPAIVRQVAAGASKDAAETEAARVLAARASDPAAAAAALEQPGELVPGSQPTTYQQTGDAGLGGLEREVATKNPEAFQQRRADQNAARVQSLSDIQQGADPNDVAKTLRAQFDDLDKQTQTAVDQATTKAQQRVSAMGGAATPDDYGRALRSELDAAEQGTRTREASLWRAVDPNEDLTGNASPMIQGADDIVNSIRPTQKPMEGEEAAIFEAARNMQPLSPVADIIALRSRVNDALAQELRTNGRTASYARLSQFRGIIQDNLANTIAHQIANEAPAVEQGLIDPSQSMAARVQAWRDSFYANRDASVAPSDGGAARDASVGSVGVPGVRGAAGEAGEPAGPSGAQGVPGTPSFDEAASQRLAEATAATKERARAYGMGPVGQVLARAGASDLFKMKEGQVPAQFFKPGPTAFADIQALTKGAGTKVIPTLVDYAAMSLRRAAEQPDGTLDPVKFARWRQAHVDALRALPPDVTAQFADAASAGRAVREAETIRAAALKDAKEGAIGKVMGLTEPEDVTRTVGQILNGRTAVADMKQLALKTRGDSAAREGLRQAVADYITGKLIGNTEAGTSGVSMLKADQFQTFMKNATPALNLIFKSDEVQLMQAIARDIQRSNRSLNTKLPGQSNTAQDITALGRAGAHAAKGKTLLNVLSAAAGATHGPLGAAAGLLGASIVQGLRETGVARVDQLVTEAMLHPQVARRLLAKVPEGPKQGAAVQALGRGLVHGLVSANAAMAAKISAQDPNKQP